MSTFLTFSYQPQTNGTANNDHISSGAGGLEKVVDVCAKARERAIECRC